MEGWFTDRELPGFDVTYLPSSVGRAALVRRTGPTTTRRAVLYLHGFADYFFQSHLADWYADNGFAFYALDLPGHGRVLDETRHPSYYADLADFHPVIDAAIARIDADHRRPWLLVNGHSTGGLIAAVYALRSPRRAPDALFLNSPFFDLNVDALSRAALPLLTALARIAPALSVGALGSAYGTSISAAARGEWAYNLAWKPLAGFPMRAATLRAIVSAQRQLRSGAGVNCPVLVAHAHRSASARGPQRDALCLGRDVTLAAVQDARHDLVLSHEPARRELFALLAEWLQRVSPQR